MKLSRIPASAPLLGLLLFSAFAARVPAAPPADCPFPPGCTGAAETAAPAAPTPAASASAPFSKAALIPALASAECAAELVAAAKEEPTGVPVCGICSQDPCAHNEVGSVCGSSGGELKFCIDELEICRHAGVKCSCRLGPI